jgi:hypothetical protein
MKMGTTASQRTVRNIRTRLRRDMQRLALTHRGCDRARGCGCLVDKALAKLVEAEAALFTFELDSYADPATPRRIVQPDNRVGVVDSQAFTEGKEDR